MNDEGQWIVLMGFIVSVSIFFLAFIISQATVVGQTTSEGVLEFPKTEIQDLRGEVANMSAMKWYSDHPADLDELKTDIKEISMARKNAVVDIDIEYKKYGDLSHNWTEYRLHYNEGVTEYDETYLIPIDW
jgi:hypothetical protein